MHNIFNSPLPQTRLLSFACYKRYFYLRFRGTVITGFHCSQTQAPRESAIPHKISVYLVRTAHWGVNTYRLYTSSGDTAEHVTKFSPSDWLSDKCYGINSFKSLQRKESSKIVLKLQTTDFSYLHIRRDVLERSYLERPFSLPPSIAF